MLSLHLIHLLHALLLHAVAVHEALGNCPVFAKNDKAAGDATNAQDGS